MEAAKHLSRTGKEKTRSIEKLASGLRINRAADDSSGMFIADSLRSQAAGLGQAMRNVSDGISIIRTADAALEESIAILNRVKTKSVQAAQDGQTAETREMIQSDIEKLLSELDEIAKTTSFNGQKLLSGEFSSKAFQVGAFSGEVIDFSIDSAGSEKLGHMNMNELYLEDEHPGRLQLAIKSSLTDSREVIRPVNLAYNNSREHGLGGVADAINRVSDITGVSASASVELRTEHGIGKGITDKNFSINGVHIGRVTVQQYDSDGALVKAINRKTSEHGVDASVDSSGNLVLVSTDGRAIKVEPPTGTENAAEHIFNGKNLSTFGKIELKSQGADNIDIRNLSGNEELSFSDGKLEIAEFTSTNTDSLITSGSSLSAGSTLAGPWIADRNLSGEFFSSRINISDKTQMKTGSSLGEGSVIRTSDNLVDSIWAEGRGLTESASLVKKGSILAEDSLMAEGTVLPAGNEISAGTRFKGDAYVAETADTASPSTVKQDSVLETGTVLASGTVIQGRATVDDTGLLSQSGFIRAGSFMAAGSTIGSGTLLTGDAAINAVNNTAGDYDLAAGSSLETGSMIASGTVLGGDALVGTVAGTNGDYDLAAGSRLNAGSELASGTVFAGDADVQAVNNTTGDSDLAAGSTLRAGSELGSGTVLANTAVVSDVNNTTGDYDLAPGSNLTAGSVLGSGTILTDNAIVEQVGPTGNAGDTVDLAAGSIIEPGTDIEAGFTLGTTTGPIPGPAVTGPGTLTTSGTNVFPIETGSIAAGSSLAAGSAAPSPGLTLNAGMPLSGNMTLEEGSTIKENSSLSTGSVIGADGGTLANDMNTIAGPMTLKPGSTIAANSTLTSGTVLNGDGVTLAGNLNLSGAMTLEAGSTIADWSLLTNGSTVGTDGVTLNDRMDITSDMTLEQGSDIANGSVLGEGSTVGASDAFLSSGMILNSHMTLEVDSSIANLSELESGSVLNGDKLTLISDMNVDSDMTLSTGSRIGRNSYIKYNSTIGADAMLLDSMTIRETVKLASDMHLATDLQLGAGSSIGTNSYLRDGSSIKLDLELLDKMEINEPFSLEKGSSAAANMGTRIISGTRVGGDAVLADSLVLNQDMALSRNSVLSEGSVIRNGSIVGGAIRTDREETVSQESRMTVDKGSVLAAGSYLAEGTYLGFDVTSVDGEVYEKGSFLKQGVYIHQTRVPLDTMLSGGSKLAAGSVVNNGNVEQSAVTAMGENKGSRLSTLSVLSFDEAQAAIEISDAALSDLARIRSQLGSTQNQLESTFAQISAARINVKASESVIREVDFADEAANLSRISVLSQSGNFALSQSHTQLENLLNVLNGTD